MSINSFRAAVTNNKAAKDAFLAAFGPGNASVVVGVSAPAAAYAATLNTLQNEIGSFSGPNSWDPQAIEYVEDPVDMPVAVVAAAVSGTLAAVDSRNLNALASAIVAKVALGTITVANLLGAAAPIEQAALAILGTATF